MLDGVSERCSRKALSEGLERAMDWGLTGLMGSPSALQRVPREVSDAAGIMVLPGPGTGADTLEVEVPCDPDLVAWPPDHPGALDPCGEAGVVLDLRPVPAGSATGYFQRTLRASPPELTAVILGEVDEECLDALCRFEDLAAFVPGEGFASGFRLGAGSHFGSLTALHPWAATRASEIARGDVAAAIALERRLQRFLEAEIAPGMRRLRLAATDRDALLLEIFAWLPVARPEMRAGDAQELAQRLRDGLPELFWDAP